MANNMNALRAEIRKMVKEALTNEVEMETAPKPLKLKAGLTQQALGGTTSMRYAEDFIDAIKELDDMKKAKAIAYVLASIDMDAKSLQMNMARIKSGLKQYSR